jgi:hypothetical protein
LLPKLLKTKTLLIIKFYKFPITDWRLPITIQIFKALYNEKTIPEHFFNLALIAMLHLFVLLSYPIYWSAYKSLNNDLHERLKSSEETTTDPTRQQGQQITHLQPTIFEVATVELASHAELPCTFPLGHLASTNINTAAERVGKLCNFKLIRQMFLILFLISRDCDNLW